MIIGLTSRPHAGQEAAASFLRACGWRTISLDDALHMEVAAAWRMDPRELLTLPDLPRATWAAANAEVPGWLHHCSINELSLMAARSARWVLQHWRDWRRQQQADYWALHVEAALAAHAFSAPNARTRHIGITHLRHAADAAWLRQRRGHLVRVYLEDQRPPQHPDADEPEHLHADAVVHHNGQLASLAYDLQRVVQSLAGQAGCSADAADHDAAQASTRVVAGAAVAADQATTVSAAAAAAN